MAKSFTLRKSDFTIFKWRLKWSNQLGERNFPRHFSVTETHLCLAVMVWEDRLAFSFDRCSFNVWDILCVLNNEENLNLLLTLFWRAEVYKEFQLLFLILDTLLRFLQWRNEVHNVFLLFFRESFEHLEYQLLR